MRAFKITIAYDGGPFVGWQRQAEGTSVQGLLEEALSVLDGGRAVSVAGAGRTDAGVHALGQVATFTLSRDLERDVIVRALNARLPPEVRVVRAEDAPEGFHARFDARAKIYRYRIWNGDVVCPFERGYVWHLPGSLAIDPMQRAARTLEGRHDFAAFQTAGGSPGPTERTIFSSTIAASPHGGSHDGGCLVTYDIRGDGFLRHMVRAIVGSLVEIGRGRRGVEWMAEIMASRERAAAGRTAPPHGLFLVGVEYDLR